MGKISISDIVELAKAGYKPSDVKELFELAETADAKETLKETKAPENKDEEFKDAFEELIKKEGN